VYPQLEGDAVVPPSVAIAAMAAAKAVGRRTDSTADSTSLTCNKCGTHINTNLASSTTSTTASTESTKKNGTSDNDTNGSSDEPIPVGDGDDHYHRHDVHRHYPGCCGFLRYAIHMVFGHDEVHMENHGHGRITGSRGHLFITHQGHVKQIVKQWNAKADGAETDAISSSQVELAMSPLPQAVATPLVIRTYDEHGHVHDHHSNDIDTDNAISPPPTATSHSFASTYSVATIARLPASIDVAAIDDAHHGLPKSASTSSLGSTSSKIVFHDEAASSEGKDHQSHHHPSGTALPSFRIHHYHSSDSTRTSPITTPNASSSALPTSALPVGTRGSQDMLPITPAHLQHDHHHDMHADHLHPPELSVPHHRTHDSNGSETRSRGRGRVAAAVAAIDNRSSDMKANTSGHSRTPTPTRRVSQSQSFPHALAVGRLVEPTHRTTSSSNDGHDHHHHHDHHHNHSHAQNHDSLSHSATKN
jgi:hypothetical protein